MIDAASNPPTGFMRDPQFVCEGEEVLLHFMLIDLINDAKRKARVAPVSTTILRQPIDEGDRCTLRVQNKINGAVNTGQRHRQRNMLSRRH